jgi:hypothetical protein
MDGTAERSHSDRVSLTQLTCPEEREESQKNPLALLLMLLLLPFKFLFLPSENKEERILSFLSHPIYIPSKSSLDTTHILRARLRR